MSCFPISIYLFVFLYDSYAEFMTQLIEYQRDSDVGCKKSCNFHANKSLNELASSFFTLYTFLFFFSKKHGL